jgi:hypothetical protein
LISKSLAVPPQHLRVAFFTMLGVAAMAGALNGAVALGEWAAGPTRVSEPTAAVVKAEPQVQEETEVAPPPPAFQFDAPLPGAAVKVAADGVVKATGVSPTYGRYVLVMHKGGLTTMYAHLAKAAKGIKRGVYLHRGDTVAFVGNSGRSTGSHLHFEIRKGDKPLNPSFFLGRSFAEANDLPIKAAGKVSRKVRLATVSKWPDSVAKAGKTAGGVKVARLKNGRVRATIPVVAIQAPGAAPTASPAGSSV